MDTTTGDMGTIEELEERGAKKKNLVILTNNETKTLFTSSRKERRQFYRKNKARFNGRSWSDVKNQIR